MCPTASTLDTTIQRRRWLIRGQVQGVGFRPFVYRLAQRLGLAGFVLNDCQGVTVEAQGMVAQLERFSRALEEERPPLAFLDHIHVDLIEPITAASGFVIDTSRADAGRNIDADVTVDTAVCQACVAELFDPPDRRRGYGLINCTNCGPRYTIVRGVPYDRANTTMSGFAMCDACLSEYRDPMDRRFHAEPIACGACGPRVTLVDPRGRQVSSDDPIAAAARMLEAGKVIAIKGLGGFHLAVRADCEEAVGQLRLRKRRDYKPFALMCRSVDAARMLVKLSNAAVSVMRSPQCPIVLARRSSDADVSESVAPQNHRLGVMLPYTPIHHLLFAALDPSVSALVMTSGNVSDEPLVIDNNEAVDRLNGLCDAMLWHDRPIERCVDDSVWLDMNDGALLPVRRSRGYVPAALPLHDHVDRPGLCVGGELKNTVAIVRGGQVILSQHLGDLTHPLAYEHFCRAIDDLCELFSVRPEWVAHDLHPQYLSTVYARQFAAQRDIPLIGVQHHHAHAASVLAEHDVEGPALAIVCDGVGYGEDGQVWGGELLLVDGATCTRLAHVKPLRLPGGDAAARDTRRCGLALLHQCFGDDFEKLPAARLLVEDAVERQMMAGMIRHGVNCAETTAVGRVFDGVAALLGVCRHNHFEAQAPIALEAAAESFGDTDCTKPLFHIADTRPMCIDLSPLIVKLLDGGAGGRAAAELSALFHEQLAWAFAETAIHAAMDLNVTDVGLSGGVFCNERLTRSITRRLGDAGLRTLRHRLVPANDGGLAYGQAAIAARRMKVGIERKAGAVCV